jgi:hypothetical protein
MYEFFIVRVTNRVDGTAGKTVKEYENEADALKEFFRQAGQAVDTTHLTDSVTMLTKEGFEVRHEVFLHDAPTPEPEAEEPTAE